jgi:hypothetical protein
MRTPQEFRDLIEIVLVEEINRTNFDMLKSEPENVLPKFIEQVANRVSEICLDELAFRRK